MKEKKRVIAAVAAVFILAIVNILFFFYGVRPGISAAKSEIPKLFAFLNVYMIIFIVIWLLIAIIIISIVKDLRKKEKNVNIRYKVRHDSRKGHTDIDLLYALLKEKKRLKIGTISKTFSISEEKALEWCRILENHNLAVIKYYTFSETEIEIK